MLVLGYPALTESLAYLEDILKPYLVLKIASL